MDESALKTVTLIGAGYVGALTAITMAVKNPTVKFVVCDINETLVAKWNKGELPFYEPQLHEYYMKAMHEVGNIEFTSNTSQAMIDGDVLIIAVNTPPSQNIEQPVQ
jgi:UDPglucose 6-dehydrogenase